MLTTNHRKESLTKAYVQAVAGSIGVNIQIHTIFDYGFDGSFRPVVARGKRLVDSGFPLDFQLKSTSDWSHVSSNVSYRLENKTYNDLVTRPKEAIGAVLILLCLPSAESDWIDVSEDHMKLRHCCYFQTFQASAALPNENSKTTFLIPRSNLLTGLALRTLLQNERTRKGVP